MIDTGHILGAINLFKQQTLEEPLNWWPFYRLAWCYNQLDQQDSAFIYAEQAFALEPGNERCLTEVLKSLSSKPEEVLRYSSFIAGGGVCRYRLARAELQVELLETPSYLWLINSFENGDSAQMADAGVWLSFLEEENSLQYIEKAVALVPGESFYRSVYIGFLIDELLFENAIEQFEILKQYSESNVYFWQTASSLFQAMGDDIGAIEASRRAYECRMVPATAADLGWKLYFYGRGLLREENFSEAIPFLIESNLLWSSDSLWALKSDSLLNLLNEYTSTASGFGEPL